MASVTAFLKKVSNKTDLFYLYNFMIPESPQLVFTKWISQKSLNVLYSF